MKKFIDTIPLLVPKIKDIKDIILTNIVLLGQVPSPTFHEEQRADLLLERFSYYDIDECSTDGFQNPLCIIKGTSEIKPPIFVIAHLDTFAKLDTDHNYTIKKDSITGPGIIDNSTGIGVLASLPEIFKHLHMKFESDIILAGVVHSLGKGNLAGIRYLMDNWNKPIRGAICIEGGEIGRLNYYSNGTRRCEIECNISTTIGWEHKFKPNAILILNEIINEILKLALPQRPRARVIIGKISGGFKHGVIAYTGRLGFEIQSDSDKMVQSIYNDIKDIVEGINYEYLVELKLSTISNIKASSLKYNHPLVKNSVAIMKKLGIQPISDPSSSELSILLSHNIPAVTLGITHGENYHLTNATVEIEPMFKGIAQIISTIKIIDSGICDEK